MSAPAPTARVAADELHASGLVRTYGSGPRAVHALRGVDLVARPGELVVIRGRSGSGKTTLLHALGGLERLDAGTVRLGTTEVSALPERELLRLRRERAAFVFQSFGLLPVLSAAENVEVPLRLADVPGPERAERVAAALDAVGLTAHARQRPDELSGGQQQRVAVARALVARPALLLADEPTAQLDSETALTVMDVLLAHVRERRTVAVLTTHDPLIAERADRVLELRSGVLA
ncbi:MULTISPECIES: ABC transporter ATP-binding protein [unclassified Cellulomonas]|uniref:ABC transporter ATP-binding protein n=1 Tax=unclassified Cellulomonas TaxID=2620175 RepID=UPI0019BC5F9C|nr:ABC transporter ATP-binding protein [Cellulomonas sp. ES6]MBD3780113.1 ABC transporter ATP-binding protein [Micrococcales bacterium]WHP16839.1 ABC transporter ATP-binding protein [Cellulomonas sp. ES6]